MSARAVATLAVLVGAAGLGGVAVDPGNAEAACRRGSPSCPIEVIMRRGTDTITVRGALTPGRDDCCAYSLRVRAGQVMTWRIAGPAVRTAMLYPNGRSLGPGVPQSIRFPVSGVYLFGVRPNFMSEDAYGPYALTFTIR
jgi:hypothetical protein